jgi:hypothetical protein
MFGHVVDVGAGKRRGLPATLLYDAIFIVYPHVIYVWYMLNGDQISTCNLYWYSHILPDFSVPTYHFWYCTSWQASYATQKNDRDERFLMRQARWVPSNYFNKATMDETWKNLRNDLKIWEHYWKMRKKSWLIRIFLGYCQTTQIIDCLVIQSSRRAMENHGKSSTKRGTSVARLDYSRVWGTFRDPLTKRRHFPAHDVASPIPYQIRSDYIFPMLRGELRQIPPRFT